eukprot:CAMPEP_0115572070 /NCGR_PEP_ID=MMETSP0272-20121206/281_1 /TAXON_ID=71861 /ORGANISM="Scrippsiella trochoidea, Strain CCMP3099" /LENGTH=85 /DNA_ID=CAMNT_0003006667 /DNA_START=251 /DNA_END=508 /DNA_ORIENTATION=+
MTIIKVNRAVPIAPTIPARNTPIPFGARSKPCNLIAPPVAPDIVKPIAGKKSHNSVMLKGTADTSAIPDSATGMTSMMNTVARIS